jgi:1,4-dihydroxy-6-naphthoate synthase
LKLTIGFSPCPNDTFIFDALVNSKIDTGGFSFDVVMEDVETLNRWAIQGKLNITKLSYGVLPLVLDKYILLTSGSALGTGVGPLLISNKRTALNESESCTIAVPGEHTTANLLFSLAYPWAKNKVFLRYNEIEAYVSEGKGPGVIIHENRFTYQQKGLFKIMDLGEFWEKETGNAIPLGGIVIQRTLGKTLGLQVNALIRKSIEFAYVNNSISLPHYVKMHASEMSEEIMKKHIALYVNTYSLDLGISGKLAIMQLLKVYQQMHPQMQAGTSLVFIK